MRQLAEEMREHLDTVIIPFWRSLRDEEKGGYFGECDCDLQVLTESDKGVIMQSRILWFFSYACVSLGDDSLLEDAQHAYHFLKEHFIDHKNGGVYFSVHRDGQPADTSKHTYCICFAISALSAYYKASGDDDAYYLAVELFKTIELRCRDEFGYVEAMTEDFKPIDNELLSENGVLAKRTMNCLLHLAEAYADLLEISGGNRLRERLAAIIDMFPDTIYNSKECSLDVFFDDSMKPIIDLRSYGHDIEAAWLMESAAVTLTDGIGAKRYADTYQRCIAMCRSLAEQIYTCAYRDGSLPSERVEGEVDNERIWWGQAECVLGFANAYMDTGDPKFLKAAYAVWDFICDELVDKRRGGEWFWSVGADGTRSDKYIAGEWKGPYHNGRMCLKIIEWCAFCERMEEFEAGESGEPQFMVGDGPITPAERRRFDGDAPDEHHHDEHCGCHGHQHDGDCCEDDHYHDEQDRWNSDDDAYAFGYIDPDYDD